MGGTSFAVRLTESAIADLHEIDDYWASVQEPERGEQYVRNLIEISESELSSPIRAAAGRRVKAAVLPDTHEILVLKGSYRIIYRIDPQAGVVHVLRFWHTHRKGPALGSD
jgi:plasmid stabilization system protein ParE